MLILNDLANCGGAELQTFREAESFRRCGYTVTVMTFDDTCQQALGENHINIPVSRAFLAKALNRIVPSYTFASSLRRYIQQQDFDYVRVNNCWKLGKSVYSALPKNVRVIQTVRDFSTICPRNTAVDVNGRACNGYTTSCCVARCGVSVETTFKLALLASFNHTRRRYVQKFVAPSKALTTALSQNNFDTTHVPNPFEPLSTSLSVYHAKKCFLYFGRISKSKGVDRLIEAWRVFSMENKLAELRIAGTVDPSYLDEFNRSLSAHSRITFLGQMDRRGIGELLQEAYCVVVPSYWLENYPNTVLEAQASKTLVIGADRGGIPEMINDSRFTFDILKISELINCLRLAWLLSPEEYANVVEKSYHRVLRENSKGKYIRNLQAIFSSME